MGVTHNNKMKPNRIWASHDFWLAANDKLLTIFGGKYIKNNFRGRNEKLIYKLKLEETVFELYSHYLSISALARAN